MSISSIVTGSVESCPSIVIAAESPTSATSMPAASASRALGASYTVTIVMRAPLRFIAPSSGTDIFPPATLSGPVGGGWLLDQLLSDCPLDPIPGDAFDVEDDVVDQAVLPTWAATASVGHPSKSATAT